MENENTVMTDIKVNETGKVSFAPDVIATIANLAASDVEGVTGLGGGFADSLTGILGGKKSYTKGVRVEVGQEEAAVDMQHMEHPLDDSHDCRRRNRDPGRHDQPG